MRVGFTEMAARGIVGPLAAEIDKAAGDVLPAFPYFKKHVIFKM
jgi:hypothetical protein